MEDKLALICGYPIDKVVEIVNGYKQGKLIPVEWMKSWAMKNWVKTKKCVFDVIVTMLINDWLEKENGR